jgi:hypothetical protein
VEFPLAVLQFFSLNHQTKSDKGFSNFFEAINLELLSEFQEYSLMSFLMRDLETGLGVLWHDGRVSDGWEVVACSS